MQVGGSSGRKTEFFADQTATHTANPVDVSNLLGRFRRPGFKAAFPTGFKATWITARQGHNESILRWVASWRLNVASRQLVGAQDRILCRLNRNAHSESSGRFESFGKIPAPRIQGGVSHRIQSDMDYSAAGPRPSEFSVGLPGYFFRQKSGITHFVKIPVMRPTRPLREKEFPDRSAGSSRRRQSGKKRERRHCP